jgi:hypothetical protein
MLCAGLRPEQSVGLPDHADTADYVPFIQDTARTPQH